MDRIIYQIILILISQIVYAQNNDETLSKKLWGQVQNCYSMFEDMDGDGKLDYEEIIDDSKNGYLKVSGSFPTCGCTCKNTVGAYKTYSNEYVFVKKYSWSCSWEEGISSSDSLTKLFPFDFEADGFFQTKIDNPKQTATFYLDVEIPRNGTDTKVIIKPIPLGLKVESENNIEFSYREENRFYYSNKLFQIRNIVSKIKSDETIEHIFNNNFVSIAKEDSQIIEKAIGTKSDKFENKEALIKVMRELRHIYDLYIQIKYEYLVLGWNKVDGTFYIKEKSKRINADSFIEFLKRTQIWVAIC